MELLGNTYIDMSSSSIEEISLSSSSKGNQRKYYDHDTHSYIKLPYEYQGRVWKDYLVEHLSWRLSTMMNTFGIKIVKQDIVTLSIGRIACMSKDFLYGTDKEWLAFYRITNEDFSKLYGFPKRMFDRVASIYDSECGVDARDYLAVMIVMDYLLLNEDRHFNNFGVIRDGDKFEVSPLFDFGLGLFEHDLVYKGKTLNEALEYTRCKPFSRDAWLSVKMLLNIGMADKVQAMVNGVRVPDRRLFPNVLSYDYFQSALERLMEELRKG